jgi:L-ribulokinase
MKDENFVIGVDYGTDSVRSIIVDAGNGNEISGAVVEYPRWKEGQYCDPAMNQFRQHPLDYIEGMEQSIHEALGKAPKRIVEHIKAISIDTTGSTPVAVNEQGTPLALLPDFKDNPNAMFILWKDHTAVKEAAEINDLAHNWGGIDYTKYEGGVYSSEWFWSKILHTIRIDSKVRKVAFSWVEHCDWIPAILTARTDPLRMVRSRCAAGHKAMWHESFGGLPCEEFLVKLDPLLKGLRERLYRNTFTCDLCVGTLTDKWAKRLGLNREVVIGAGSFDAHLGAVGGEIEPYYLSKVMGTSTCDMLVAPMEEVGDKLIKGICGQVDGSIIPGMLGMEAGQSSFGDVYAWFRDLLFWSTENILVQSNMLNKTKKDKILAEFYDRIIPELSNQAEKITVEENGIIALDWLNGRRTPFANQELKAAITGLNLGSSAVKIFRALVEATAFGAKKIVEQFIHEGIPIKGVIGLGGVAKKSPFIMQVIADVLNMPIKIARSEQACALGSAMAAAVVAKIHPDIPAAQKVMGNGFEKEYHPDQKNAEKYKALYQKYENLGNFIEEHH